MGLRNICPVFWVAEGEQILLAQWSREEEDIQGDRKIVMGDPHWYQDSVAVVVAAM